MARLLVVSFSVVPGPDRHGIQLVHTLRALASRFTVDVLTVRVGELGYVERFLKTRMLRVPVPGPALRDQVEAFRRALRRQLDGAEYDVVHFRDAWSGVVVLERRRRLSFRTVFDVGRSAMGDPRPADEMLARELERDEQACFEAADLVILPTDAGRRHVVGSGDGERFVVVPPGVDIDRFDAEAVEDSSGPPRILYAGTIASGRGVRVLLRAFRELRSRREARLCLVGPVDDDFRVPLAAAIAQLDLAADIEILGAIDHDDLPRVITTGTVCVAPLAADLAERPTASFPTKILEYLACGRAVVAPRQSSLEGVVEDGVDALLFTPGDPLDLAQKLERLLVDAELRDRLAQCGQERVRARFAASRTRRLLLEAYARLVPRRHWNPIGGAAPPLRVPSPGTGSSSMPAIDALAMAGAASDGDTNPSLTSTGGFPRVPTELSVAPPVHRGVTAVAAESVTGELPMVDTQPSLLVPGDRPLPARSSETTDSAQLAPQHGYAPSQKVFVAGEIDLDREITVPLEFVEPVPTDVKPPGGTGTARDP